MALALASLGSAAVAQETTASIRGSVISGGKPVEGATVVVVHKPSGTASRTVTGATGSFVSSGLRPGGPYTVTVTASGRNAVTRSDLNLTVGQPYTLPIVLAEVGEVEEVVVTGVRDAGGLAATFDRDEVQAVASVARDIRDIARRDPFASFNPSTRGVSIAGANNRTNRFSVDGVRFSDNFGLQNGGLPTKRGPVPLDAIEQLSVKVAPYDVTEGDFQGGSINVVLRSGGNDFTGAGFYTYNSDGLTGDKSKGATVNLKLKSKNYGGFISGPIIEDKFFVAASYERLDETVPATFGLAGAPSVVPRLTQATLDQVSGIASSVYSYDTLGLLSSRPETDEKWTLKLDYNISDSQRLSYTFIHNEGETIALGGGSISPTSPTLGYTSYATHEPEKVNSHVLQLNSDWTSTFSTELRANYRKSTVIPVSFGSPGFAQFQVCTDPTSVGSLLTCTQGTGGTVGTPRLFFGTEQFSQADIVGQEQYGLELVGRLNIGDHALKAQAVYSHLNITNLFVQSSLGLYTFNSVADFQNRRASILSLQNSITGSLDDLLASFSYDQITFGVQDSWDISPELNLTYGLRADLLKMSDNSPLNQNFVNRYGMPNNYNLDGIVVWEPRVSATWRPMEDLTIRGGVGLFSGGSPDVFIGNSFSVAGVFGNTITLQRDPTTATGCTANSIPASIPTAQAAAICAAALNNVTGTSFDPAVLAFLKSNTASLTAAPVNALTKDFKPPSTWKTSLSADYRLDLGQFGDNWRLGADVYYGKVKDGLLYRDLRVTQVRTAPDGRPIYADTFTNSNNNDLLLSNTHKGYSLITVARINKAFDFGLDVGLSYTHSDVKSLGDQNGTTASGTYGAQPMSDPNYPAYGTSEYEVKDNWKLSLDYEHAFFGDLKTRANLFGEYRSGAPYSVTMNVQTARNVFGASGSTNRFLLYVPDVSSQTADSLVIYNSSATFEALKAFVQSRGLKKGIVGKNSENAPDYFKVDLHLEQELPAPFLPDARIKAFADIENLLNLVDSDWGAYRTVPTLSPVVNVACATTACTQYRYSSFTAPVVTNQTRLSLWSIRIGARFEF